MVRQHLYLISGRFLFFDCVIKKKVDQNRVDFGFRMVPQYLSADELNAPDTAPSELDLTVLTYFDFLLVIDAMLKWWTVHQTTQ